MYACSTVNTAKLIKKFLGSPRTSIGAGKSHNDGVSGEYGLVSTVVAVQKLVQEEWLQWCVNEHSQGHPIPNVFIEKYTRKSHAHKTSEDRAESLEEGPSSPEAPGS
jgi:hypothetical protein